MPTCEAPASASRKPSTQTKVSGSSRLVDHSKNEAALLGVDGAGVVGGQRRPLVGALGPDGELDDDQDHGTSSERVEAALQQAELVALGVGEHVPALVAGLADVGPGGAEAEQPLELGVLVAVGGVDVDVQPELARRRVGDRTEDQGGRGPPKPASGPISTTPSSSRPSTR